MPKKSYFETQRERQEEQYKYKQFASMLTRVVTGIVAVAAVVVVSTFFIRKKPSVEILDVFYKKVVTANVETYEAAVTINIDDNHETLKKDSLIITLDSKEDHFEITPTSGTNEYSFSNLVYNRRYKLRVKGDWGYGKGTIREKEILVNEEARAKVTNITQEGRNIMFSYYVIDSFETLENTVVEVNVYSNDELIDSVTHELLNFNNLESPRSLRITNKQLEIPIDSNEIKIEILNDNIKLEEKVYKIDKSPKAHVLEIFHYNDARMNRLIYLIGIVDDFDQITEPKGYITINSNAITIKEEYDLIKDNTGRYLISGGVDISRLGKYTLELKVIVNNKLTSLLKVDKVLFPSYEVINYKFENNIMSFDLESVEPVSITIKNDMKLVANLYDMANIVDPHSGYGTPVKSVNISPHKLKDIYFKDVKEGEYFISIIATLYKDEQEIAYYYPNQHPPIIDEDHIKLLEPQYQINETILTATVSYEGDLSFNTLTNIKTRIYGVTEGLSDVLLFEDMISLITQSTTHSYDLVDERYDYIRFDLYATKEGENTEMLVDSKLLRVTKFRAFISNITPNKRSIEVSLELFDIDSNLENLELRVVDENNLPVGSNYNPQPGTIYPFLLENGTYQIMVISYLDGAEVIWASQEYTFTRSEFAEIIDFKYNLETGLYEVVVDSNYNSPVPNLQLRLELLETDYFPITTHDLGKYNMIEERFVFDYLIKNPQQRIQTDYTYKITLVHEPQPGTIEDLDFKEISFKRPALHVMETLFNSAPDVSYYVENISYDDETINDTVREFEIELWVDDEFVEVRRVSEDELIQSSPPFTRVPPLTEQSKVELKFYYIKQATQERIMILYRLATFNA